ncbi:MAG: Calcineurin-like phosphoesterase [Deltaproteobacteria bacterium ADurb.Bin510]|nr:MAG: Calcineurin-like phosphoesterase [Deltaproteobacteria bacterium ADurb.Bin510]
MKIFAIADLHLSLSAEKPMDIFGEHWREHPSKIASAWRELVAAEDLVLIPGDISWAMRLSDAATDLAFIHELPGTKVIIRGNHDYWWSSLKKLRENLPSSIVPLQNTALTVGAVGIAGSRLWIDPDLALENATDDDRRIYENELARLELSLKDLPAAASRRIIMSHFPPIALDGRPSRASILAERYGCELWVFGHMHLGTNAPDYAAFNRVQAGTRYEFAAADYLDFRPKLLLEV